MRIVLVNPPYSVLKQGKGALFSFKGYGNHIPCGLALLAAVAEADGHGVEIVDGAAEAMTPSQTANRILACRPDVVGITATTAVKDSAYSLAAAVRERFGKTILLGGPHAIAFGKTVLEECPALSGVCFCEGEKPFLSLLQSLSLGLPMDELDGLWMRQEGRIVGSGRMVMVDSLDSLPIPAYGKFDARLYKALPQQIQRPPFLPYITSRGCTWKKCTFCFQAGKAGQTYRRSSPTRVVRDIERMVSEYGIREVVFWDDNFLVNPRWLFEFADLLESRGVGITWSCYGRVDTVSEDILVRMRSVGLWNIFFGLETGNPELLLRIRKGITVEQSRKVIGWCNRLGIVTRASFMLALPGSTPEIDRQTIEFAKEINPTYAQFHLTFPERGTALYDMAVERGTFRENPDFKGRTTATYIPTGYSGSQEVEAMARKAYRSFYLRPSYIAKHLGSIRSIRDIGEYMFGFLFVISLLLGSLLRRR